MNTLHIRGHVAVSVRALIAMVVLLSGLGTMRAFAQNEGSISGSVQDAQKGQIPDAKVTVTRTETGLSQTKDDRWLRLLFLPRAPSRPL